MVAPVIIAAVPWIIRGGIVIGGLFVGGKAAEQVGDAADGTAELVKWGTAAAVVYVSFKALKASGALK